MGSDQLSYFALTAGIIRGGYRAFPISPRNSTAGVANLLQKMAVKYLFVSGDQAMQELATTACEKNRSLEGNLEVELLEVPTYETLFGVSAESSDAVFEPLPLPLKHDVDSVVMILHSSGMSLSLCLPNPLLNNFEGSTSFPKPIPITHRNFLQWGSQPCMESNSYYTSFEYSPDHQKDYGETDICGRILSNHSLPFFRLYPIPHQLPQYLILRIDAMGVVSICWAVRSTATFRVKMFA